jgi:hypothetical protein
MMRAMRHPREVSRVVISTVDPPPTWNLPAAVVAGDAQWMSGGAQSLHELAVAAAVAGYDVELRGEHSPALLDRLESATGARPLTPAEERRPSAQDIVIVAEGGWDPLRFARYLLSPARVVVAMFAPLGLFGWPFSGKPVHHDPLHVDLEDLARPEYFRALAALGADAITHMNRVQQLADENGLRCHFIGNGSPFDPPALAETRDIDVVYLEGSRWLELATQAVAGLRRPAHRIAIGSHAEVLDQIARAKVLVWPARVEGHGRVLWEARVLGTVVVALRSNVFATGLEEAAGAIAVETVDEVPAVVERLLDDEAWRTRLSQAGRASAIAQADWRRFVARVTHALDSVDGRADEPQAEAFAWFGRRIEDLLRDGRW